MSFKDYVGIDVSKLTLDVFIWNTRTHRQFKNDQSGFILLVQWTEKQARQPLNSILFCFEHTGLYSLPLAVFLEEKRFPFAMIPPLEIKRSIGITRGKNDRVDSQRIAEYAYRFNDKISLTKLPAADIRKIQFLLVLRARLSICVSGYVATMNETLRTMNRGDLPELFLTYEKIIITQKEEIKKLEKEIRAIIHGNSQLRTSFELITGIKGIGLVIACNLIVYTYNFTRFGNWRKFACYSGIAPFDHQSGTSVRGRTQVSSVANKQMKKMLHMAATCAIRTDAEMREYYRRRVAEGKSKMAVVNIVRNKIVARAFAVVKRGTPFVDLKKYAV
jgi:transposase